jgi:hypothetical protein
MAISEEGVAIEAAIGSTGKSSARWSGRIDAISVAP